MVVFAKIDEPLGSVVESFANVGAGVYDGNDEPCP